MKKILLYLVLLVSVHATRAQSTSSPAHEAVDGWHLLDPKKDGYMGISLAEAYQLLKGRTATPVIVAVIDSGIDTAHEDLKAVLWHNEKEIAGNGIDDDGNGYVDDIYGWNFCGSPSGENLVQNTYETARVYHGWKDEFEGKKAKDIPENRMYLYTQWKKAADLINKDYDDASKELDGIAGILTALENSSLVITAATGDAEFTAGKIKPLKDNSDKRLAAAAGLWLRLFSQTDDPAAKNTDFITELKDYKNQLDNKINRKTTPPQDFRGALTRDNYTDIHDLSYGNNNLKAGSGNHGTLVSGTIAAVRNNGIGMDGIADHVRIMAIRAVPGGDEHDKDVALAIRYAVDNGAKVINMSFGKPVSPYKQFVDDAVKYAADKGVLLVHGCGNDGTDITKNVFYPNPYLLDGTRAGNFISVGASGDEFSGGYAASFSNYSKESVDLFAPGVHIYSTAGNDTYEAADGTSLASPVVTGVAALLKSYFPQLTPAQIRDILMKSGTPVDSQVTEPGGSDRKVKFSSLSVSGRILNAANAVQMALDLEKGKKPAGF